MSEYIAESVDRKLTMPLLEPQNRDTNYSSIFKHDWKNRDLNSGEKFRIEHQVNSYLKNYFSFIGLSDKSEDLIGDDAFNCEKISELGLEKIKAYDPDPTISSTFIADTEWDGVVIEVKSNNKVYARVWDALQGQDAGEEFFELSLDKIITVGHDLCKEGAIFRWSFGYLRTAKGTKQKHSKMVFRRIPSWSRDEVVRIEKLAAHRASQLSEK
ncbi:hypothetical protein NW939_12820 [Aeromonas caviae]|uniref:hypothetical protein n=1 Tax=Aeromonas caviae TaxID=648 RepID=UPI0021C5C409|nr:hypothetical protein [Aeromonas caviae]MCR9025494.1 hypothetical protein [Aeromonas caviae]